MQAMKYSELEDRASQSALLDEVNKLEARSRVHAEIEAMRAEGKALTLSDEEMDMLKSFRRFKLRMTKDGEVFKWQSRKPEGVQIVEETAQVIHPAEALDSSIYKSLI